MKNGLTGAEEAAIAYLTSCPHGLTKVTDPFRPYPTFVHGAVSASLDEIVGPFWEGLALRSFSVELCEWVRKLHEQATP